MTRRKFRSLLPETKNRSLEEMDIIFGSVKKEVRDADVRRMQKGTHYVLLSHGFGLWLDGVRNLRNRGGTPRRSQWSVFYLRLEREGELRGSSLMMVSCIGLIMLSPLVRLPSIPYVSAFLLFCSSGLLDTLTKLVSQCLLGLGSEVVIDRMFDRLPPWCATTCRLNKAPHESNAGSGDELI